MLRFLPGVAGSRRVAVLAFAFASAGACSLTEAVRSSPGSPGDIPDFGNGGSDGGRRRAGGAGGADASADGRAGGAGGFSGSAGHGGGGRSSGGTRTFDAEVPDGRPDAAGLCPFAITFGCNDYCNALSLSPGCTTKLRQSAGLGPVLDAAVVSVPDGATPPETPPSEILQKCKCDCETRYRSESCRSAFDQFVMCGAPPLTMVCSQDPATLDAFPSVIGAGCGAVRTDFLECFAGP